jgi:hypothetical protein
MSIMPPGMALAMSSKSTPNKSPPPVRPKPNSAGSLSENNTHHSPSLPNTSSGHKIPSNAVRVLPFQQATPTKGSNDDDEAMEGDEKENAGVPTLNGIHSNGMPHQIDGNPETPVSFDKV